MNNHADVQAPISQLLQQSKDLAHEIRTMFNVLEKREAYLVSEMEKLKRALANAIRMLQDTNAVAKLIRRKRYDTDATNTGKTFRQKGRKVRFETAKALSVGKRFRKS